MNSNLKVSEAWDRMRILEDDQNEPSPQEQKLDRIRQASNVIQALENVIAQCEDNSEFTAMKDALRDFHWFSRRRLQELIHQS